MAFARGNSYIPKVMIVGLVSAYDHFLSRLLSTMFSVKSEIIFTSDKKISFSDLKLYKSIDEARDAIINKEVEAIIRESHHEQFKIIENRLQLELRKDLNVWPDFVELCERRNLFSHTGGVVSAQYLSVCRAHGCKIESVAEGDLLHAKPQYFENAVRTVFEVGAKLAYVIWRKTDREKSDQADYDLNELCFTLIMKKQYKLATSILKFCSYVTKKSGSDNLHKMITVNLANALRLDGHKEASHDILKKEDWTATNDKFQSCVASILGDTERVISVMKQPGGSEIVSAEEYRTWPVFRITRDDTKFKAAFKEVFGEDISFDLGVDGESKINTELAQRST